MLRYVGRDHWDRKPPKYVNIILMPHVNVAHPLANVGPMCIKRLFAAGDGLFLCCPLANAFTTRNNFADLLAI